jgi:hypothetical protein
MAIGPSDLFPGVADVESSWKPGAVGPAIPGRSERAIGLTQILPSTAARYGYHPEQLRDPGVQWDIYNREMGRLLQKYKGDPVLALAAWNDGEANVDRNSIAPSTLNYVRSALSKTPHLRELMAKGPTMPDTSTSDMIRKMTTNPRWKDYSPEQQSQLLRYVTEGKYKPEGPTPSPGVIPSSTATAKAAASPSAKPTATPAATAAMPPPSGYPPPAPSPTAPAILANTPAARPTMAAKPTPPNLGLPGGPAIAPAGPLPVVPTPPSMPGPYGTPSAAFPSRTFGASGPDLPTEMQQLQSRTAEADIEHPIYAPIRKFGTEAARLALMGEASGSPEYREEQAQDMFPQDPVGGAVLAANLGLAAVDPLAEAIPEAAEAMGITLPALEDIKAMPGIGTALRTVGTPADMARTLGYGARTTGDWSVPFDVARRLGTNIGVGALTGGVAAKPGERLAGAMQGGLQGGIVGGEAEAIGGATGMLGRIGYKGKYVDTIVADAGDVLRDGFESGPEITRIHIRPLKTIRDFEDTFVGPKSEGLRAANQAMDKFKSELRVRLGGNPIYSGPGGVPQFPMWDELPLSGADRARYQSYTGKNPPQFAVAGRNRYFAATGVNPRSPHYRMMTFDEINEQIARFNDLSFTMRGDPRGSNAAMHWDNMGDWYREQFFDNLNRALPGENWGDKWSQLRTKYGAMQDQSRVFGDKNIDMWSDKEQIPNELQRVFGQGKMARSTSRMLGRNRWQELLSAIRGGLEPPAYVEPSENIHLHGGMGFPPHVRGSMFRTFKPVGTRRKLVDVGRGMIYPQRGYIGAALAPTSQVQRDWGLRFAPTWIPFLPPEEMPPPSNYPPPTGP